MAEYKVTVSENLIPVLEAMAKLYGLDSIEDVLRMLLDRQLAELEKSADDPLIGLIEGPGNLAENDEDIMYGHKAAD